MHFSAILFDLDGTLIDSLADIADSCNRVLASRGYPTHPYDAYRYFIGDGVKNLLLRSLPPEARAEPVVSQCVEAYNTEYAQSWHIKTRPYPGVPELLAAARAIGLRLAVLSNKPDAFTLQCVREILAGHQFNKVMGDIRAVSPQAQSCGGPAYRSRDELSTGPVHVPGRHRHGHADRRRSRNVPTGGPVGISYG